jgi:CRP/FNR family transcriptional regulator
MESAAAETDSLLISFTRDEFLSLLQQKNDIAMKILGNLADELGVYNNLILHRNRSRDVLPAGMKMFNMGKSYFNRDRKTMAWYILTRYRELFPGSPPADEAEEMLGFMKEPGNKSLMEPEVSGNDKVFQKDSVIFCEFEPGKELYIIREGKVKIIKSDKNAEMMLALLGEGDIFGELAIISDKPRNATAISYTRCRLTPVNRETLVLLMNRSPDVVNRIFASLCQRIWFTFIRMEAQLYRKPITRIYAFLENKLREEKVSLGSARPYTFSFGIEDLFSMLELEQEKHISVVDTILEDDNLHFNFGKTTIEDPGKLHADSKLYKSRDHLRDTGDEKEAPEEINLEVVPGDDGNIEKEIKTTGITPVADKQITHAAGPDSGESEDKGTEEPDERKLLDIESLIKGLKDESAKNRNTAARRIGQFGAEASFAVPKLAELLNDEDRDVRMTAMKSINDIMTPDEAANLYTTCLNDKSCFVRSSAARALG